MRRGTSSISGLLVGVVLAVSSCGIPTGGDPESIAPAEVPYGLTSAGPTSAAVPSPPPRSDEPHIYLVNGAGLLIPRGRPSGRGAVRDVLAGLLAELADGPTGGERSEQLSTALPPDGHLSVAGIDGRTATIEIQSSADAPSGQESRRAVAQIVLTATSLPQIGRVVLTRDGKPVEAPLPSGELTSASLAATDYAPLLSADYAPLLSAPPS